MPWEEGTEEGESNHPQYLPSPSLSSVGHNPNDSHMSTEHATDLGINRAFINIPMWKTLRVIVPSLSGESREARSRFDFGRFAFILSRC